MTLDQLANLGDFIGGLAVLVTLVYLAIQVRQGTNVLASSRHHEMLDHIFAHNFSRVSENREYAEFILNAQNNPETLDDVDWYRFVVFAYGIYAMWEDALIAHRRGLIDAQFWAAWEGGLRSMATGPGYRRFWQQEGHAHSPDFQEYVNEKVFPE